MSDSNSNLISKATIAAFAAFSAVTLIIIFAITGIIMATNTATPYETFKDWWMIISAVLLGMTSTYGITKAMVNGTTQ